MTSTVCKIINVILVSLVSFLDNMMASILFELAAFHKHTNNGTERVQRCRKFVLITHTLFIAKV